MIIDTLMWDDSRINSYINVTITIQSNDTQSQFCWRKSCRVVEWKNKSLLLYICTHNMKCKKLKMNVIESEDVRTSCSRIRGWIVSLTQFSFHLTSINFLPSCVFVFVCLSMLSRWRKCVIIDKELGLFKWIKYTFGGLFLY